MERQELLTFVQTRIADTTGEDISLVTEDKLLKDGLGLDSLDLIELIMAIESEYNISITDAECEAIEDGTLKDLIDTIHPKVK